MKKAVVVAGFGTTYEETGKLNIGRILREVEEKYPACRVVLAYTSSIVRRRLKERGVHVADVPEALCMLHEEGYREVAVLSTHVIQGEEYGRLEDAVNQQKDKFYSCRISKPLLATREDCAIVLKALYEEYRGDGRGILAMGHGSPHPSNARYAKLNEMAEEYGMHNFYIATVEGTPVLEDAAAFFRGKDIASITLVPLMLVAGDHAVNDMAGKGEASWKSLLQKEGWHVDAVLKGLGEYPSICRLYERHLEEIF